VRHGSESTVIVLHDLGALLDDTDDGGHSALHEAAENNNPTVALRLLSLGADSSITNFRGQTPMDVAQKQGCDKVARVLGSKAANPALSRRLAAQPPGFADFMNELTIEERQEVESQSSAIHKQLEDEKIGIFSESGIQSRRPLIDIPESLHYEEPEPWKGKDQREFLKELQDHMLEMEESGPRTAASWTKADAEEYTRARKEMPVRPPKVTGVEDLDDLDPEDPEAYEKLRAMALNDEVRRWDQDITDGFQKLVQKQKETLGAGGTEEPQSEEPADASEIDEELGFWLEEEPARTINDSAQTAETLSDKAPQWWGWNKRGEMKKVYSVHSIVNLPVSMMR